MRFTTIDEIFESYWPGFLTYKEMRVEPYEAKQQISAKNMMTAIKEAYELGKASKKCKEDNDNPYNIDYKRQTKLDL